MKEFIQQMKEKRAEVAQALSELLDARIRYEIEESAKNGLKECMIHGQWDENYFVFIQERLRELGFRILGTDENYSWKYVTFKWCD